MRQHEGAMGEVKEPNRNNIQYNHLGLPKELTRDGLGHLLSFESAIRMCLEDNVSKLLTNGSPYAKMASNLEKKEVTIASRGLDLPESIWAKFSEIIHSDMSYCKAKFDIPDFNHATAVFIGTYLLVRKMGYSNRQSLDLATGGFTHDIAKKPEISHNPGKLTLEEWDLDERHPEEGYRILLRAGENREEVLEPTLLHQKWKWLKPGSKRRSYPVDAQSPTTYSSIVATTDSADVMLRGRPYRRDEEAKNGSVRRAISELERESLETEDGLHFDRRIVEEYTPILRRAL